MATQFQKLSGTFLIMAARVTCRACFERGHRGRDAWVIDPALAPSFGGALSARWQREIVRAARRHYSERPEHERENARLLAALKR